MSQGSATTEATVTSSPVNKIIEEILSALEQERNAILTRPSRLSTRCFDGRLLVARAGANTYRFALENEHELAAGLPVLLLVGGRCTRGHVQTMKGSEVQVVVEENLGDEVAAGDLLVLENLLIDQMIKLIERTRDGKRKFFDDGAVKRVFGIEPAEVGQTEELEIPQSEQDLLNDKHRLAIQKGSASNMLLLSGPSGTGKTRTIATLAVHLASMGERILLVSHTPSGCDRALDRFYATLSQSVEPPPGSILRLGPAEELSESTEAAVTLSLAAENSLPEVLRPSYLISLRAAHRQRLNNVRKALEPIDLRSTTSVVLHQTENQTTEVFQELQELDEMIEQIRAEVAENEAKKAPEIQFLGEWDASPVLDRCRKQILSSLKTEGAKLPFPEDLAPVGVDEAVPEEEIEELLHRAKELAHAYPACKPAVETVELLKAHMTTIQKALPVARVLHRAAENALLEDSLVIGTTVTRGCLAPVVFDGEFDTVIIDEAHRVAVPALFALAGLAKQRVILSGDFRMPSGSSRTSEVLPVCRKAFAQDIYDWSGVRAAVDAKKDVPALVFLDTHYREYPDLTKWQGEFFYGREIRDGIKKRSAPAETYEVPWAKGPVTIVDSSMIEPWTARVVGRSSRFNLFHAAGVALLVNDLLDAGYDPEGIAVVCPGEAQLKAIQKLLWHDNLTSILVATVQQFQNTDRDVVIFDIPDGPPGEVMRTLSGPDPDPARRLLNVPLSRARRQAIFLCNLPFLRAKTPKTGPLARLLEKVEKDHPVVPLTDVIKNTPEVLKVWCDLAAAGYANETFDRDIAATSGDLYFWGPVVDLPSVKRIGELLSRGKEARTAYIFTSGRGLRDDTGHPMTPQEFSSALFGHAALPNVRFVLTTHDPGSMALLGNTVAWATTQSILDSTVRRMGYARVEAPELGEEIHRMYQVSELLGRLTKVHENMAMPTCTTCKEPQRLGSVSGHLQTYCGCAAVESWKTLELAGTLTMMAASCPRCGADLAADAAGDPLGLKCPAAGCGFTVAQGRITTSVTKTKRKPTVRKTKAKAPAKKGISNKPAEDTAAADEPAEGKGTDDATESASAE